MKSAVEFMGRLLTIEVAEDIVNSLETETTTWFDSRFVKSFRSTLYDGAKDLHLKKTVVGDEKQINVWETSKKLTTINADGTVCIELVNADGTVL